jgi:hypothetical protein
VDEPRRTLVGYAVTVVGAAAGAVTLGYAGLGLGEAYAETRVPGGGFEQLGWMLLGAAVGGVVGLAAGPWILLRLVGQRAAGLTGVLSAVAVPVALFAALAVWDRLTGPFEQLTAPVLALPLGAAVGARQLALVLAARHYAGRMSRRHRTPDET